MNDSPVTLAILKSLGEKLIDIHSQHATLQINTEEFQFLVVDNVAKSTALKAGYLTSFLRYKKVKNELRKIKEQAKQAHIEADFNQFQFDELHQASLTADEQVNLEAEQQQLENAEEIKRRLTWCRTYLRGAGAERNLTGERIFRSVRVCRFLSYSFARSGQSTSECLDRG
ncbi:hypothetical protein [Sphingobacterium sp. IITKGP-BTPF85]|uniref:hypothetical protein n=1 Tax=Sphingobacterium sp. IITKGP-BTPF85 TaxID=1338009 RepID=UPI0003FB4857|nr:hypothetical protein [Sphingobacterium sp. IITKGP-BTPF85]KKX48954.1 hypothetical protein L950_0218335 [Sphingobacterium sp. IITKGP-BTPF85]